MPRALATELHNLAGRQLGRYEVLTQLASGGMAAVYVARAKGVAGFERLVAIKVLHPHLAYEEEFISMFLDEARLAARIHHPNVVGTLDISDTQGDGFFLVMEYVEGDHLGAVLAAAARAGERIPTPVVARIVLDALHGLAAAHDLVDDEGDRLELVHRDISPHNVMVGVDGVGRLTDFGVAKAEKRLTSTRAGHFKGKLAYMAPEQASTGYADQRSDLFAMGILLWESLTGRRLFRADNNAATLTKLLQSPIPRVSEVAPELAPFDALLDRALTRDAEGRFQSAEELAEALEQVARAHGGVASARSVGSEVRKWRHEKLDEQRERVKGAMTTLGHADVTETALPVPRDGSRSSTSRPGPSEAFFEGATTTGAAPSAPPSALSSAPPPPTLPADAAWPTTPSERRRLWPALGLAVITFALGGGALWSLRGRSPAAATELPPVTAVPDEAPPTTPADGPPEARLPGSTEATNTANTTSPADTTNTAGATSVTAGTMGAGSVAAPRTSTTTRAATAREQTAAPHRTTGRRPERGREDRSSASFPRAEATIPPQTAELRPPTPVESGPESREGRSHPPQRDPAAPATEEPIFNPYRQ